MRRAMEATRQAEGSRRLDSDVNRVLQDLLVDFNDHDTEELRRRLRSIDEALGDDVQFESFVLGGSVAKHTAVSGLSDVDALLVFDRDSLEGNAPTDILNECMHLLSERLSAADAVATRIGTLSVTVTYQDGMEIQVLPAVRSGNEFAIPNSTGTGWRITDPYAFRTRLTAANERLNFRLVPTIKVLKSLLTRLPEDQRLSGYHQEALSLETTRNYDGPRTVKALLLHVLENASGRVLEPVADVTGQNRFVDADLGPADSPTRRAVAASLAALARQLRSLTTAEQWRHAIAEE